MLGLLAACAVAAPANAATIFSDNFNGENGGTGVLNYTGFANWAVSNGTVDLIGNGFFDFYPGNGLYLDLDGSTSNAGDLTSSSIALAPGNYTLTFAIGGNQRYSAVDTLTVSLGSLYSESFAYSWFTPLTTITRNIAVGSATNENLTFSHAGGDNVGMILDNVSLSDNVSAVPEPATCAVLGLGVLPLLKKRFRRA